MKLNYKNKGLYNLSDAYRKYGLVSSNAYKTMGEYNRKKLWNGLGRANAWYNYCIPDTVYGLDISLASADHDISYASYTTQQEKVKADRRFLYNMNKIIDKDSVWHLKWVRKRRAYKYYLAVKLFGWNAFNAKFI